MPRHRDEELQGQKSPEGLYRAADSVYDWQTPGAARCWLHESYLCHSDGASCPRVREQDLKQAEERYPEVGVKLVGDQRHLAHADVRGQAWQKSEHAAS